MKLNSGFIRTKFSAFIGFLILKMKIFLYSSEFTVISQMFHSALEFS